MSYTTLLFEMRDAVATVTVNRPEKLNALNAAVIAELGEVAGRITSDPAIRGAILTGAGPKAFVAGADIGEIAAQGPVDGKARALEGQRVFRNLERCGKPVIAAVNGFALGGGCELAMACHLRVASEQARFGQPEVKLGIGPGYGGTVRLPRLVGKGRALELLLTGQMIDAQEAYRIGLVNRVVPADRLLKECEEILHCDPRERSAGGAGLPGGGGHRPGCRGGRGIAARGQPVRPPLRNGRHAGGDCRVRGQAKAGLQGGVSLALDLHFAPAPGYFS